jgi:threonine dehydrogenase-like Zn-dependent dehydrogenase
VSSTIDRRHPKTTRAPAARIQAAVQTGDQTIEMHEFARPAVAADDAVLRVEACGICGTDIEQFHGAFRFARYPVIPGHEPLGVIDEIGERAAARWGVAAGDRVAIEPVISCGSCRACLSGSRTLCPNHHDYGMTSTDVGPGVWGAFADYMYLDPDTVLHKVSPALEPHIAAMFNPIGAGVRWAVSAPSTKLGDTVVVLGAGQRGLACVIAAKAAGADPVIVTDLARASHKLDLALELGASHAIVADAEDPVARVIELTGGELADVVVDVASGAPEATVQAIQMVRAGGTVVLASVKGHERITPIVNDEVMMRSIRLQGVFTVDSAGYREAIRMIERKVVPFERMHSARFGLSEVEAAINRLAGDDGGPPAIHVTIEPGAARR